ncbi:MAG: UvrD-helicase domain-containing protein [Acidobacteriota bacterium]
MIEQLHASAGSGKTYRLTRRFLHLLMQSGSPAPACGPMPGQGYGPESILAITFTNKAAAEMKERVLLSLKSLALGLPDPDFTGPQAKIKARSWLERTLRHFQTLNIRTIDSLLNQLARLFALELGLAPDFETSLDEAQVFEALYDAVTGRMGVPAQAHEEAGPPGHDACEHESLPDLAGRNDASVYNQSPNPSGQGEHNDEVPPEGHSGRTVQSVDALVGRMTDALTVIDGAEGFWLAKRLEKRLREVFTYLLDTGEAPVCDTQDLHREMEILRAALVGSARTMAASLAPAGVKPMSNFNSLLTTLGGLTSLNAVPESVYARKASLEECVLAGSRAAVTPGLEHLYGTLREDYRRARTRGRILAKALAWQPFIEFGALLLEAFDAHRRDKAVALLSQLPGSVAHLLAESGGVPEAYCRLGSRLNHLLIDEFQDTSLSQWDVLSQLAQECLSKGGSLFYVGDVKQAIYSWRGGEAELFEAAARQPELALICPDPTREHLSRNWRSAPEIVSFNNRVFSCLESEETSRLVSQALLPDASEGVQTALQSALAASFSGVSQDLPPGRDDGGLVRITRLPGDCSEDHEHSVREALAALFEGDLLKRRPLSEIAVLTRTNDEAAKAAQWLVDLEIPVVTENSLRLAEHPVVRGAVSFLAFLDYPPDNLALWGFLSCRELFCRPQSIPLQALTDWLTTQGRGPLYRKFQADFPEAWQRLVEPFLKGGGPASPYDLVQELFTACGVFEAYPGDEVFLRRFLELVHNAETQGFGSLSSFLEFWRDKGHQEKIPQPENAEAVRVLTIHKAKGLEFPVAVIPFNLHPFRQPGGLTRIQPGDSDDQGAQELTAPLCKELGEVFHRQAAKSLLEQINLLYVAWTRPEEELHIFLPGADKLINRTPLAKATQLMLRAAGFTSDEPETVLGKRPPRQAELIVSRGLAHQPPEPTPLAEPLGASPPLDWLPGLKIARCELGDPLERLRLTERKRGIVLHKALEILKPGGDALSAVLQAMAASGLTDEDAALELAEGLEWLAGQEFFPQCHLHGLREAELLDADGAIHRPDLMAFTGKEALVLDYKTGREDPSHHEQLRRYLRLVQALPQADGLPARGLIAYLDLKTLREVLPGETL